MSFDVRLVRAPPPPPTHPGRLPEGCKVGKGSRAVLNSFGVHAMRLTLLTLPEPSVINHDDDPDTVW